MNLPKSTLIAETIINSDTSYQLKSMTYKGRTTYSTGKQIRGSYYPKEFSTLEDAQAEYNKLTEATV
jgi:hypothetical protein